MFLALAENNVELARKSRELFEAKGWSINQDFLDRFSAKMARYRSKWSNPKDLPNWTRFEMLLTEQVLPTKEGHPQPGWRIAPGDKWRALYGSKTGFYRLAAPLT